MTEKAKKVYEAPFLKVYEIGRTLILAVSGNETEDDNYIDDVWED